MLIIEHTEDIEKPFRKAVVTIGNFDGVHIGHQSLFHQVIQKAEAIGGTSVAITFEPHPLRVLTQDQHPPLITLYEQKKELIAATGLDALVCLPFTLDLAAMPARAFVEDLLVKRIGMRVIIVGRDYSFGRGREGDIGLLQALGGDLGYDVVVADWITAAHASKDRISSTRVRELVMEGRLAEARQLLGRHYQIRGTVVAGRNRGGKLLGFPTANVQLYDELCPQTGIYAVTIDLEGQFLQGVANIGYSPTFDDHLFTVEVHILDFAADIYGRKIKINFLQRIRDEIKFESLEALSDQIRRDIEIARDLFNA
ncbi:MAG: bifunctional riboflavin kinase/FAD synthetase [Desulfobacterales bacterium]|nr:bifunctional riboflavin kinase/FAD synthetase [Desulfobacterales bacterium]MDJ0888320.1 bifunctional riboflavin kinase/FAD synthetase [Desulfobacterales bacterium]MDJ0990300.1 bifunctional riboflavin kinase/FAD synthetase [Desulfobacterales bacterium]